MISTKGRIVLLTAASIAFAAAATPAAARGCNGVVNQFVWGCAVWDNNVGPQFPYWQDPKSKNITIPTQGSQIRRIGNQQQVMHNGKWLPVIAAGGGNVIAAGGGNVIASGGGN